MKRFLQIPPGLFKILWILCIGAILPISLFSQISITKTDASCGGAANGSATVSVTGGTPPYSYYWSTGSTDQTINDLKPGYYYSVYVMDSHGCSGTDSVFIETIGDLTLTIQGTNPEIKFCANQGSSEIILTAVASGGTPPYTFSWPGASKQINASGRYYCTVTDSNLCLKMAFIDVVFIPVQCAIDPNEILGPNGYDEEQWVSVNDKLSFSVYYENDPDFATASAQKVSIKLPISDKAKMYSLRLGDFGFGNFIFSIPPNTSYYTNRLDVVDSLGVFVDLIAGLDVNTNEAFWIFQAIDPATGLPPNDPQTGFLPVNDSVIHNGEGFVTFTFEPKSADLTGDSIKATAAITFDINEAISTNTWVNLVDAFPPISAVDPLPPMMDSTTFNITFTGQDDPGGCGINKYQLFFSKDAGPFEMFGEYNVGSAAQFTGVENSTYGFFSRAIDHVGNMEPMKSAPDATTTVGSLQKNLFLTVFLQGLYDGNGSMREAYDETGPHFGLGIADQVTIELHNATNYATIEYSRGSVNLSTAGNIVITGIPAIHDGSYYITIRHRNSIETTTAQPVSFAGGTISYDFSTAASKAYGDNLLGIGGVFMIYGAEVYQDGIIDLSDMVLVETDINLFAAGYLVTDVNGDGIVDLSDMVLVEQNIEPFVSSVLP